MMLSVRDLSFTYASAPILDHVSFDLLQGDCVAILGINGAGKSTLLKCIDRILPHKTGRIEVEGKEISKMSLGELARWVGYVPQKLTFGDSTVFDAVLMGRKPYIRWEAAQHDLEIVSDLLERLGLSALALQNVSHLSGGEQQKVAIARALAQEPKILLFDEPTSNLDLKNQMEVANLIRSLAKERALSVVVTMHDLNLALRFADRFILMKDRFIHAVGGREIITADAIQAVYGLDVTITEVAGHTVIVPT